jgi:hypothetical protein
MKRIIFSLCLLLTACASQPQLQIVTKENHEVIVPPDNLFDCPIIDQFPDSKTITDIIVARLLINLQTNNIRCYNSMNSIKKFLENAKKVTENSQ